MLHGKFYDQQVKHPLLVIEYPERAKKTPTLHHVDNEKHAYSLWTIKERAYILDTLIAFVNQRKRAINAYPSCKDYADHAGHIFLLLSELPYHYDTRLEVLAGAVYYLSDSIKSIRPWKGSPYRKYYDEVITPILYWCDEFSQPYRRRKQKGTFGE